MIALIYLFLFCLYSQQKRPLILMCYLMTLSWRPPGSDVSIPNASCPTWSTLSRLSGNSWWVDPGCLIYSDPIF